jgi:hypothetical protein
MPDLPTIQVTQTQADRILAAFGTVTNYKTWLKNTVRDAVINHELEEIRTQAEADLQTRQAEILDMMPD